MDKLVKLKELHDKKKSLLKDEKLSPQEKIKAVETISDKITRTLSFEVVIFHIKWIGKFYEYILKEDEEGKSIVGYFEYAWYQHSDLPLFLKEAKWRHSFTERLGGGYLYMNKYVIDKKTRKILALLTIDLDMGVYKKTRDDETWIDMLRELLLKNGITATIVRSKQPNILWGGGGEFATVSYLKY